MLSAMTFWRTDTPSTAACRMLPTASETERDMLDLRMIRLESRSFGGGEQSLARGVDRRRRRGHFEVRSIPYCWRPGLVRSEYASPVTSVPSRATLPHHT